MSLSAAFNSLKSSNLISWKTTGKLQQTLAGCIELAGKTLHTGKVSKVKVLPGFAGEGRNFEFQSKLIPASIDFARESPLCTTLCKDGYKIRTVEHLLSALEAKGIDNCIIQIRSLDPEDSEVEVPIFDGSASAWVEAIEQVGRKEALDRCGNNAEKLAPYLNEPLHVLRNDSFIVGLPSSEVCITCGIDFPKVNSFFLCYADLNSCHCFYASLAKIYVNYIQVEHMRAAGLIKGGSLDNAIVCSATKGWLNPPLRFHDEPCRHKVLDLIGDLSLFARSGSQGFPVAHIVSFKGGHSLNADLVRRLSGINV
ncbi:probable UDP-3-O-acyl-N-acetylglucosamine deacetylase 1, mitochondrial [Hibiscus syriacus]|uniref:probable UDP-3-O-acyl-N-acetylglucosamine deacetylase 1, mitochondrial n=1 Tax=Hibiscus syriacus TaxID=106335 RepID=UPI0019234C62|nr:probable UDP-3-O-acyl-N-acetylglucosamine deacetylase 1, mitochondrial [Hibiscus syriacus]